MVCQHVEGYLVVSLPDRYCREGADIDVFHLADYHYLIVVYREVDVVPLQEVDHFSISRFWICSSQNSWANVPPSVCALTQMFKSVCVGKRIMADVFTPLGLFP